MTAATGQEGGLWRPANGTEGADFEANWCAHCLNCHGEGPWEDEFGNDATGCCMIAEAMFWQASPTELIIRDGAPHCTAFREDPANPARCLKTKEMF